MSSLSISKDIALNSPKYTKIIEPFGDSGTFMEYLAKKKPKEHIVNFENEDRFNEMLFVKDITGADKRNLKARDWVGSQEAFDKAVSITATEGIDFYYKRNYLQHFAIRQTGPEAEPVFDLLETGEDVKLKVLGNIPVLKGLLKNVTLLNEDPVSVMNQSGDFYILAPRTPEQIEAVDGKLATIGGDFFYLKKSKDNEELAETVKETKEKVSVLTGATIMVNTFQIITNYDNKLPDIKEKIEGTAKGIKDALTTIMYEVQALYEQIKIRTPFTNNANILYRTFLDFK